MGNFPFAVAHISPTVSHFESAAAPQKQSDEHNFGQFFRGSAHETV